MTKVIMFDGAPDERFQLTEELFETSLSSSDTPSYACNRHHSFGIVAAYA